MKLIYGLRSCTDICYFSLERGATAAAGPPEAILLLNFVIAITAVHIWFSTFWFLHVHSPFCPHYLSFLAWSCSERRGSKRLILALTPEWIQPLLFSHVSPYIGPVVRLSLWTPLRPLAALPALSEELIGSSEDPTRASPHTIFINNLMIEIEDKSWRKTRRGNAAKWWVTITLKIRDKDQHGAAIVLILFLVHQILQIIHSPSSQQNNNIGHCNRRTLYSKSLGSCLTLA